MSEEVIKKCNGNEYLLTPDKIWVRNFCKPASPYISVNNLIRDEDRKVFIKNEIENRKVKYMELPDDSRKNVIIISDGFDFKDRHKLTNKLPEVSIIATNKALRLWELVSDKCENKKAISYYVINNPYPEAETLLPNNGYYPKCLSSCRTFPGFVSSYKGPIYSYLPVPEKGYSGISTSTLIIDDYRNPICAALSFAKILKANKIMLMCCDDSFKENRPGSVKLANGLFCYPQQLFSQNTINANVHWLVRDGIRVADFSSGGKLSNTEYINDEHEMINFFESENVRQ